MIDLDPRTKFHTFKRRFKLESGDDLAYPTVACRTWGELNAERTNVVIICHALTGNADADVWFKGIFESELLQDKFVICMNVIGSCYGSTGPQSINPSTGKPYGSSFPKVTIRDMVNVQRALINRLGIQGIDAVIGGSMGGMQALEWAITDDRIRKLVLIAMGKAHSAWAIGVGEAQRRAIMSDPKWKNGDYEVDNPPKDGLATARMMAMLTYRSFPSYEEKFGRNPQSEHSPEFAVESYLDYQGKKLAGRFDAMSYVRLTQAMDTHDVSRGRGTFEEVLGNIRIPTQVIGIDSDVLYPPKEQKALAGLIPGAMYHPIKSKHGHDAFLIEFEQMNRLMKPFLSRKERIAG
jgi:homoserine O-acetyltransferase